VSSDILIRLFQSRDSESLVTLWQNVLPSSQPWNEPTSVLYRKTDRNDDLVFVAEQNGAVVGAVMGGYDGIRGWIYSLAVSPDHRRRNVGRMLMDQAESALVGLGCPKVNLQVRSTNSEVLEFYQRCGYVIEDRASLGKRLTTKHESPGDPVPTIQVTGRISLSQITNDDRSTYLRHLNATDEFRTNMCTIPYPYTEFDADQWLSKAARETLAQDHSRSWAIRNESGELIGGVGLIEIIETQKAEIGYWLAKPYWGQGVMTQVLCCLCRFAFDQYRLQRIHAEVFATNPRSASVLMKAGFRLEGTLRNEFFRDDQSLDIRIFGLLKEELRQ